MELSLQSERLFEEQVQFALGPLADLEKRTGRPYGVVGKTPLRLRECE